MILMQIVVNCHDEMDHVRFGSFASFWPCADHFRSPPTNGHSQGALACLKGANERTRFRGRGWRRGRAITSAAVTL